MLDNQFIEKKVGLFSLFESSMPAFNRMLRTAHLTIPIKQDDDFTVIPVSVVRGGKVSHEIETGIRTFCNHLEVKDSNCTECGDYVEQDCNE